MTSLSSASDPLMPQSALSSMLREQAALLAELQRRQRTNRLKFYKPYSKQHQFHASGASKRERLFMAGNQLGKTLAGAAEAALHLTGRYDLYKGPNGEAWPGHRFSKPITMLAGSESYELTRDGVQRLLVGPPMNEEDWGTGYIPQDAIVDKTRRSGVSGALDSITVKHVSGGVSTLFFKAYEQGRGKWQANTVDYVWPDEEPPEDVYFEAITRTNATMGLIAVTFTPLKGMSSVVARFLMEQDEGAMDREVITMTIEDADHYSPEERAKIIASYPAHEREARTKGIPSMGSGLIFPVIEEDIVVEPFDIPKHWVQIGGLDFGWDHPTAAACIAWDRDADVIYITKDYRQRQATPVIHAAAIKPWGEWLPWAWPHDGNNDMAAGPNLASQYGNQGLNMLPERATFEDGSNSVEAGLMEMLDRMQTGRLKVFRTCGAWLEERRIYHRKDGKVVKERDDVISASRYAIMMKRFAETEPKPVTLMANRKWVV
ncbi:MAG: terminase large subunit [Proteobacteria bacterium]|nr:terminase large subunit [Pseudomonadota bacterium]